MIKPSPKSLRMLLPTVVAVAFVTGGLAIASIPGNDGTISGCYDNRSGILRVIDAEAGGSCRTSETPLTWSQTGPQ
nr:hypothetical protein [Actinomycetota bacterium]